MGEQGPKQKGVDSLQYQMMVSSQNMPYETDQVKQRMKPNRVARQGGATRGGVGVGAGVGGFLVSGEMLYMA